MTTTEPDAPTEDETLLGGESGNDFDFDRWSKRLATGKYDGHVIEMAGALHQRAMDLNTRRWKVHFQNLDFTEDTISAEAAEHAERFSGLGWGFITALVGQNVGANIRPARAVLYGIARADLGQSDQMARVATRMPAATLLDLFSYVEVDPVGKGGSPT